MRMMLNNALFLPCYLSSTASVSDYSATSSTVLLYLLYASVTQIYLT